MPTTSSTAHPTTSTGATMQAIVQDRYGDADVLRLAHVARPAVSRCEVLVDVGAAGLDRGTWHLMTGKPYLMRPFVGLRGPRNPVLGRDVAGTVAETASRVTRLAVGDAVCESAPDSFAEYAVAGEDKLAHKPTMVSF